MLLMLLLLIHGTYITNVAYSCYLLNDILLIHILFKLLNDILLTHAT